MSSTSPWFKDHPDLAAPSNKHLLVFVQSTERAPRIRSGRQRTRALHHIEGEATDTAPYGPGFKNIAILDTASRTFRVFNGDVLPLAEAMVTVFGNKSKRWSYVKLIPEGNTNIIEFITQRYPFDRAAYSGWESFDARAALPKPFSIFEKNKTARKARPAAPVPILDGFVVERVREEGHSRAKTVYRDEATGTVFTTRRSALSFQKRKRNKNAAPMRGRVCKPALRGGAAAVPRALAARPLVIKPVRYAPSKSLPGIDVIWEDVDDEHMDEGEEDGSDSDTELDKLFEEYDRANVVTV
jgi:hypothetical protein